MAMLTPAQNPRGLARMIFTSILRGSPSSYRGGRRQPSGARKQHRHPGRVAGLPFFPGFLGVPVLKCTERPPELVQNLVQSLPALERTKAHGPEVFDVVGWRGT